MARKLATAAICFTGSGTAFQSFRYLCASKAYLTYFSYSLSFCDHYSITCPDSLLKIRGKVDNLVICILFKRYKKTSSGFYSPYQSYSGSFPNVRSPVECVDEKKWPLLKESFAHASPYMLNFQHIQNFGQETTIVRMEQCPSCGSRGYMSEFSPDPTNAKVLYKLKYHSTIST